MKKRTNNKNVKEIKLELRPAHSQGTKPLFKSYEGISRFLMNTETKPYDYDVEIWLYGGSEWQVQTLSGDEFLNGFVLKEFQ